MKHNENQTQFGNEAWFIVLILSKAWARLIKAAVRFATTFKAATPLLAVMGTALCFRLLCWYVNSEVPVSGDSLSYLRLANDLHAGKGFVDPQTGMPYAYWPPGWPLIIATVYWLFGPNEFWLRLYQLFASTMLCLVLYLLAAKVYGKRAGWLASLFCATYTPFVHPQIGFLNLLNDPSYHLFLVSGLLMFFSADLRPLYALIAGLLLGFNALIKPDGLIVPAILLIVLFSKWRLQRRFFTTSLLLLFGFSMSLLPWTVRNFKVFHTPVLVSTNSGVNLYVGNAPTFKNKMREGDPVYDDIRAQGNGLEQNRILNQKGWAYFVENVEQRPGVLLRKIKYQFDPFLPYPHNSDRGEVTVSRYNWMYVFGIPFVLLGFFSQPKHSFSLLSFLMLGVNFMIALVYLGSVRYRLHIEPLLIVMCAVGILSFVEKNMKNLFLGFFWLALNAFLGTVFSETFPELLMRIVPGTDPL